MCYNSMYIHVYYKSGPDKPDHPVFKYMSNSIFVIVFAYQKPYQKQLGNSAAVSAVVPAAPRVSWPGRSCRPAPAQGTVAATVVQSLVVWLR